MLRHKLGEIGVQISESACRSAIERIRSGRQLHFEIEPAPADE